ncbi:MAG: ComEC family competence protein [Elusimicrobiaceae bacterium]|nr:ComEC family competence protein [Elusimicrobiaceae bacterium]
MHYTHYKRPLLWVLIFYICCLSFFYQPHPSKKDISAFIPSPDITLTAQVDSFPTVKSHSATAILKVYSANGQKTQGYVYARFPQDFPAWKQTLQLTGKLQKPYTVSLLGNFDWGQYLAHKNIFAEIKVSQYHVLQKTPLLYQWIYNFRQDILNVFEQNFPADLAAIASGVLLGEKTQIDPVLYMAFQDSGAIHLLVASGGNVAFVTWMVFAFCGLFSLSRRKTAFIALFIAGIYTMIAGADAPLTRAYFMSVCTVLGYILHRNSGVFQGLILSCLVILIFNPCSLFETGFQMSFLATLGIVVCLNNYDISYQCPRWLRFFSQIFLATLSAQLALFPIFTNVFYKVSWMSLFANMLLVPFASFLMAVSFLFYAFSCLHLGWLLKPLMGFSLWLFKSLVLFFGQGSFSSMVVPAWRMGSIVIYYAGLFLLFHLPQREFVKRIYKPVLFGIFLIFILQESCFSHNKLWLLNDWNKNSILLSSSTGKYILIGAEIDGEKLAKALLKAGSKKLDAVLINQNISAQMQEVEKLKKYIDVQEVIIAFSNIWPQEEQVLGDITVKAQWGLLLNREKKLWQNRGYTGDRDCLSYQIRGKDFSFITAGNNRFILKEDKRIDNIRNGTKKMVF